MVIKQFANILLSMLALPPLPLLLQVTLESFFRVRTDCDLLFRNFIVFQNCLGCLGFNCSRYLLFARRRLSKVLLRARLYFVKSPVRLACLNSLFLLRIDWIIDLLSQVRLRLVLITELGIVCFIILIKMQYQESNTRSMSSDNIEFQSSLSIR